MNHILPVGHPSVLCLATLHCDISQSAHAPEPAADDPGRHTNLCTGVQHLELRRELGAGRIQPSRVAAGSDGHQPEQGAAVQLLEHTPSVSAAGQPPANLVIAHMGMIIVMLWVVPAAWLMSIPASLGLGAKHCLPALGCDAVASAATAGICNSHGAHHITLLHA